MKVLREPAGVVIVNYNCAPLSLSAALSVLADDPGAHVVIVDNKSTDDSLDYFASVFSGETRYEVEAPQGGPSTVEFAELSDIGCAVLTDNEAPPKAQIMVLPAQKNRGFAAGCNLGMAFLSRCVSPGWFLLLNPDALITRGAMDAFRTRLAEPQTGLCGATVLRFEPPFEVQAFGGARLDPLTLQGQNQGAGKHLVDAPSREAIDNAIDYPLGAAMACRADYREAAGDLDERFFLYFEEADWARRGAPSRRVVWAPGAVVYHRHGASAGSRQKPGLRGALSDYHMARSRMLYALKWRPGLAPLIYALTVLQSARRILRGHWRQSRAVIAGALSSKRAYTPKLVRSPTDF